MRCHYSNAEDKKMAKTFFNPPTHPTLHIMQIEKKNVPKNGPPLRVIKFPKTHFGLLLKIFVKTMAFNQDIDDSGIAH